MSNDARAGLSVILDAYLIALIDWEIEDFKLIRSCLHFEDFFELK